MAENAVLFGFPFWRLGFRAEQHDSEDNLYEPKHETEPQNAKNLRENPDLWQDPYDQGKLNSCVANAAAALYSFELKKTLRDLKEKQDPVNPSRTFIWYFARDFEIGEMLKTNGDITKPQSGINYVQQYKKDARCSTRSAMKVLQQYGVCDETDMPYPTELSKLVTTKEDALNKANEAPSADTITSAKPNCILRYERLDKKRSRQERDALKSREESDSKGATTEKDEDGKLLKGKLRAAITESHPVVFGIHYYHKEMVDQFREIETASNKRWSLAPLPSRHEKPPKGCGSHAVLAVGYDDYSVVCQTSYGKDFIYGNEGMFLVPWSWISDFEATEDFWILRGFQKFADHQV